MHCEYHWKPAAVVCAECGTALCETCVTQIGVERPTVTVCPVCGERLRVPVKRAENLSERSFWYFAATALFWPLSVSGLGMVSISAAFVWAFSVAALLLMVTTVLFPFSLVGLALACGCTCVLFVLVIQRTALGEDGQATTPETRDSDDAVETFFLMVAVLIVWATPAGVAYCVADCQVTTVFWILAAFGALFLPMSLLAVGTFRSLRGLHPVPLLAAMARVPVQYAFCCAFFYFLIGSVFLVPSLGRITGVRPLDWFLMQAVFVYTFCVAGRLLGGLHAANSVRFGWIRSPARRV